MVRAWAGVPGRASESESERERDLFRKKGEAGDQNHRGLKAIEPPVLPGDAVKGGKGRGDGTAVGQWAVWSSTSKIPSNRSHKQQGERGRRDGTEFGLGL